jgi:translation elongation factor EF-1alpha
MTGNEKQQLVIAVVGTHMSGRTSLLDRICANRKLSLFAKRYLSTATTEQESHHHSQQHEYGFLSDLVVNDLLYSICQFLPVESLISFSMTSSAMNELCSSDALWQQLLFTFYKIRPSILSAEYVQEKFNGSWRDFFLDKYLFPVMRSIETNSHSICFVRPVMNSYMTSSEKWNSMTGAYAISQIALVVLSATDIDVDDMMRTRLLTLFTVGVKNVILVINKVDLIPEESRKQTITILKDNYLTLFRRIGFATNKVKVCLTSVTEDLGIYPNEQSSSHYFNPHMTYADTYSDLITALDNVQTPLKSLKELRATVFQHMATFSNKQTGVKYNASIVAVPCGLIKKGDKVKITNIRKNETQEATVVAIHHNMEQVQENTDDSLEDTSKTFVAQILFTSKHNPTHPLTIEPGCIVYHASDKVSFDVESIEAQMIALEDFHESSKYLLHVYNHTAVVRANHIKSTIDKRTGRILVDSTGIGHTPTLFKTEAAMVELIPEEPIFITRFADFPPFGRYIISEYNEVNEKSADDNMRLIGVAVGKTVTSKRQ